MFNRLRIIAIGAAYAFGLTSLFTYYTADDSNLLLVSVLVIMLAHFVVAVGTIRTTLNVASGKRKNSAPSQQNTNPTIRLWKQAIRRAWPWHAALIIPKMGLSLAFVQYLHMSNAYMIYSNGTRLAATFESNLLNFLRFHEGLWRAYTYMSVPTYPNSTERMPTFYLMPQWETLLLGFIVLALFTLASLSLWAGLTILSSRLTPQRKGRILTPLALRVTIFGIMFASIMATSPLFYTYKAIGSGTPWPNICIYSVYRNDPEFRDWVGPLLDCQRLAETIYPAGLTLGEQGILLATNIMRPVGEGTAFTSRNWMQRDESITYDNRPFVLRQMVAAALGLGLYGLLTWGALRLAKRGEKPLPYIPSP